MIFNVRNSGLNKDSVGNLQNKDEHSMIIPIPELTSSERMSTSLNLRPCDFPGSFDSHFPTSLGRLFSWQVFLAICFSAIFVLANCTVQVILDHRFVWGKIHWFNPDFNTDLETPVPQIPTPVIRSQAEFVQMVRASKLEDAGF